MNPVFQYDALPFTLAAGAAVDFYAYEYLSAALTSSTDVLALAPRGGGTSSFGPLYNRQVIGDGDAEIGMVRIRNDSGAPITGLLVTSTRRMTWNDKTTVTIDGSVVTIGAAAHGAAAVGAPIQAGGVVRTDNAALANAQACALAMTTGRALLVKQDALPENEWRYAAAAGGIVNTNVAVPIVGAAAAGLRNHITGLSVSHEALTNATELVIRDGAAGAVLWREFIPAATARGTWPVPFKTPLVGTAATLLEVCTLTASGAGAVYVNAQGYVAP